MEEAYTRERAVWAMMDATDEDAYEAAADAANDAVAEVVDRIARIPARTLDGLKVKAAAVAWCCGGEPFEIDPCYTADVRLAQSIVADLRAMGRI